MAQQRLLPIHIFPIDDGIPSACSHLSFHDDGVKLRTEVVASPTSVVPAIVDFADENKVDLIVVGTRGRSGFTKLLLGSVASGVVTYASCPVMVVK